MQKKKRLAAALIAALLLGMLPAAVPAARAAEEAITVNRGSLELGGFDTLQEAVAAIEADTSSGDLPYSIHVEQDVTVSLTAAEPTLSLPRKATNIQIEATLTIAAEEGVNGVVEVLADTAILNKVACTGEVTLLGNGHRVALLLDSESDSFANVYGGGGAPESESRLILNGGSFGTVYAGGMDGHPVADAVVVLGEAEVADGAIQAGAATAAKAYYVGPEARAAAFKAADFAGGPVRLAGINYLAGDALDAATSLDPSGWSRAENIWAVPYTAVLAELTTLFRHTENTQFTGPLLLKQGEGTATQWVDANASLAWLWENNTSYRQSVTVGIDQTAPTKPTLTATAGSTQVVLTAASSDALSGIAEYSWYAVESGGNTLLAQTQANTYTHTGLTVGNSYTYAVEVTDVAGNDSALSANRTVKTAAAKLGYAVTTTGEKGWNNKNFTLTLTYTPTEGRTMRAAKYALIKNDNTLGDTSSSWISMSGGAATITVNQEGEWYLHVYVEDSGNGKIKEVAGLYALDKLEPELASNKSTYKNLSSNSVIITGEHYSDELSDKLEYAFAQSRNAPTSTTWQSAKTKTFSGLSPKTDYSFWMRARDEAGNATDWKLILLTTNAAGGTPVVGGSSGGGGVVAEAPNNFEPLKIDMIRLGSGAIDISPTVVNVTRDTYTLRPVPKEGVAKVYLPIPVVDSLNSQVQARGTSFSLEINSSFGALLLPINFAQDHEELIRKLATSGIGRNNGYVGVTQIERSFDSALTQQLRSVLPNASVVRAGSYAIDLVVENGSSYGEIKSFAQPLTYVFSIPADVELGTRWGVVRQSGADFEFVPGRLQGGQVHSATTGNGLYLVIKNEVEFDDVGAGAWFADPVGRAAAKKLLVGVGGNLFEPDRSITRAEFVQLLVRALMLPEAADAELPYGDLSAEGWYNDAIRRAHSAGLLAALPADRFTPNAPILREEMAALLAAAAGYGKLPAQQSTNDLNERFSDAHARNTAYDGALLTTLANGFMEGMGDGTFGFTGHSTRAQAAKVILSLLQALGYVDPAA